MVSQVPASAAAIQAATSGIPPGSPPSEESQEDLLDEFEELFSAVQTTGDATPVFQYWYASMPEDLEGRKALPQTLRKVLCSVGDLTPYQRVFGGEDELSQTVQKAIKTIQAIRDFPGELFESQSKEECQESETAFNILATNDPIHSENLFMPMLIRKIFDHLFENPRAADNILGYLDEESHLLHVIKACQQVLIPFNRDLLMDDVPFVIDTVADLHRKRAGFECDEGAISSLPQDFTEILQELIEAEDPSEMVRLAVTLGVIYSALKTLPDELNGVFQTIVPFLRANAAKILECRKRIEAADRGTDSAKFACDFLKRLQVSHVWYRMHTRFELKRILRNHFLPVDVVGPDRLKEVLLTYYPESYFARYHPGA